MQEYIQGGEDTCGTITRDGRCPGSIVMKRPSRRRHVQAFVVEDPRFHARPGGGRRLRPFGACNFQLRLQDGVPLIFEIDARCSGTTYCRTLAGFNEPLMLADWLLRGSNPPTTSARWRSFATGRNSWSRTGLIEELARDGAIDGAGSVL